MPTAKSKPKPEANGTAALAHDVLTLAEAAEWLRVSEAGLKADADAGRVPGRVVAGEWRFSKAGLMEWLGTAERAAPRTGAELVEQIRELNRRYNFRETPAESEEFIARATAARKDASART